MFSENTPPKSARGGRLVKYKGRVVSFAPMMLMASASALALTIGVVQAAVISTPQTTEQVLTNEDNSITSTVTIDATTDVAAVTLPADYSFTFTNNGSIIVNADDDGDISGIYVDGDLLGSILNNELISLDVTDASDYSYVGIYVDGDVAEGALIENNGTIQIDIESAEDFSAVGIYVENDMDGTVRNTGLISINLDYYDDDTLSLYGIWVDGDVSGLVENTGTISITAMGELTDSTIFGYGIFIDDDLEEGGVVRNSGTITLDINNSDDYSVSVYGVSIGDNVAGTVENTGSISVKGSATESDVSQVEAYGIYVRGELSKTGTIKNSGIISVTAEALDSGGSAYGISIIESSAGDIINSGQIRASAESSDSSAYAYGISVNDIEDDGSISNSGTVIVKASSGSDTAEAYGVSIRELAQGASFSNSGLIRAEAMGGNNSDEAYAVSFFTLNGTFTNTGALVAYAESEQFALLARGGDGTINLYSSGLIQGFIGVDSQDVNLYSVPNGSAYYEFADSNTQAGTFTTILDGGQPWFVQDEGGASPIYATMGTTGLAANTLELAGVAGLTDGLAGAFAGMFGPAATPGAADGVVTSSMGVTAGFAKFVRGSYDKVTYTDSGLNQKVTVGSALAGGVGTLSDGTGFGVMGGVVSTTAKVRNRFGDAFSNKSTGAMVQFGFAQQAEGAIFDVGFHVGALNHDNKRYISTGSGTETASASFSSVFYGVSLGAALPMAMGNGMTVTPSARVSATQQRLGSYTETGASENAVVGSRTATVTEAKIGVEVAKQFASGKLSGTVELLSRKSMGDASFDVSMFGTSASGSTIARTDSFGKVGLAYETQLGNGSSFDLAASANIGGSGIDGQTVTATYSFDF